MYLVDAPHVQRVGGVAGQSAVPGGPAHLSQRQTQQLLSSAVKPAALEEVGGRGTHTHTHSGDTHTLTSMSLSRCHMRTVPSSEHESTHGAWGCV